MKEGRDYTRELVRKRDNHTCQRCSKKWDGKGRSFHVHHLNGLCGKKSQAYDKVSEMDGLTTLCGTCHAHTHGRGGKNRGKLSGKTETIYNLRMSGFTYRKIGAELGVSSCAVIKHMQKQTEYAYPL